MVREKTASAMKGRLDDYINLAQLGETVQLQTRLYRKLFKQVSRSNATDDIDIEEDMYLLMVDFTLTQGVPEIPVQVSKAYMICPINEKEIDDKTTRYIANERLMMDYARLREANISFEKKFF